LAGSSRDALAVAAALLILAAGAPASAQQARESRIAIDTSMALDESAGNGNTATGFIVDAVIAADLGRGFQAIVRPFVQRLAATGEWNRQIWIATVRYERAGPVALRVDAGLIPSPIGLANLMLRPHLNPTISLPASLFTPLPAVQLRGPSTRLIGAVYPYGAQATVSGLHWDARAAIIDTSPLRPRRIFAQTNPPQFANLVVGGGVTPFVGFRVGTSVARGGWVNTETSPTFAANHDATVVTAEAELSFRYTKLSGEWTHDSLGTDTGTRVARGWFVQGLQTLTPRWFAAGRVEGMSAPAVPPIAVVDQQLRGFEEVIGYRLTPEITLRGGHRARRVFGRDVYDHIAEASIVWWKRWW
jgi:hypothetical protein